MTFHSMDATLECIKRRMGITKTLQEMDIICMKIESSTTNEFTSTCTEIKYHCFVCDNRENFVANAKSGDIICIGKDSLGCGNVVHDHSIEGSNMYRVFEGKEDRNHHHDRYSDLYSYQYNFQSFLSASDDKQISRIQKSLETKKDGIGISESTKDQVKHEAFSTIESVCTSFNIHDSVIQDAKRLFANWRNDKDRIMDLEETIFACIYSVYKKNAQSVHPITGSFPLHENFKYNMKCTSCLNTHQVSVVDPLYKCPLFIDDDNIFKCDGELEYVDPLYPIICVCNSSFHTVSELKLHKCSIITDKSTCSEVQSKIPVSMSNMSLSDICQYLKNLGLSDRVVENVRIEFRICLIKSVGKHLIYLLKSNSARNKNTIKRLFGSEVGKIQKHIS